jgi:hypothetical protein
MKQVRDPSIVGSRQILCGDCKAEEMHAFQAFTGRLWGSVLIVNHLWVRSLVETLCALV